MNYRFPIATLTIIVCLILISWGYTGHRTIGQLTENYLSPNAKASVKELLGDTSIAEACTWADEARKYPELKETANWHFLNVPLGLSFKEFKNMVDTLKQANVYSALLKAEETLKQKSITKKQKTEALKFLLHFVGDIHQPMHVSRAEDKGGNTIQLNYEGKGTNLHSLIDTKLLEHGGLKFDSLALKFSKISKRKVRRWQRDEPIIWAWESYKISSELYAEVDEMKTRNIGDEYYQKHISMIELRIQQASIRLAGVLNEIFKDVNSNELSK
ncbi:S1/P1 nuclease [Pedobacter mendelii]|uniref:Endonuclease n=1 Tax=Pedobacter mendelii TaxID=1908240 RepID=A0ABQ2BI92_9SPHI|nr:S1/P1 nuclease [Pedobacter mendelii]GGI26312.1 endonuclease [Pedobacter mendelii]